MLPEATIEQFVRSFFIERTAFFNAVLKIRQPFRQRFYDAACLWDSRRGGVQMSESERILSIQCSDAEAAVITTGFAPPSHRSRYHIKPIDRAYLIYQVDTQCDHLYAAGDPGDCVDCGGSGWLNWNSWLERIPLGRVPPALPPRKIQPEGISIDPDVMHFMADHFREQAAIRQKELELYNEFAYRFCGQECNPLRVGYSAKGRGAETIINIKVAATWARVITKHLEGLNEYWLRYSLRRVGNTWLIVQVDLE
jgi:hypothetical protein